MDRTTYGNYGDNCVACTSGNPTPSPPPPPPGSSGAGCCMDACTTSSDCGTNLFCCPNHNMCMDQNTYSTIGSNCDACTGTPPSPPTPAPTNAPAPAAPSGSAACSFET